MDSVGDAAAREGSRYALRSRAKHADLQRHVMAFGRELRSRELLSTSSEIVDALRSMEMVDVAAIAEIDHLHRAERVHDLTRRGQQLPHA